MRACVIFNPAAKGQKAERFRRCLDSIAAECTLKRTSAPGDARKLAAEAICEGHETIIAAGGDGTLSEVLNGFGDVPEGFARARLGVLPLGTVNVFARELGIPTQPESAWPVLCKAPESRIDLGRVDHGEPGHRRRHYFAQLAGAGLDARAIELLNWPLKKRIGPFAYVAAGLKALLEKPADILISSGTNSARGQLVLIGNGRRYGGTFEVFAGADLRDGLLDVCIFPRASWWTLVRCGPPLLWRKRLPESQVVRLRAAAFELSSSIPAAFEIEGELAGHLPASFSVVPAGLRVLVPGEPDR